MSQVSLTNLEELNKIKLITYPDRVFDSSADVLLINLNNERLLEFQEQFLNTTSQQCNVYMYNFDSYDPSQMEWLLGVFRSSKLVIINLDNLYHHLNDFIAYFINQPTTFWLTNIDKPVYNHISKNRIYSFEFLQNLGGNFEKE